MCLDVNVYSGAHHHLTVLQGTNTQTYFCNRHQVNAVMSSVFETDTLRIVAVCKERPWLGSDSDCFVGFV